MISRRDCIDACIKQFGRRIHRHAGAAGRVLAIRDDQINSVLRPQLWHNLRNSPSPRRTHYIPNEQDLHGGERNACTLNVEETNV